MLIFLFVHRQALYVHPDWSSRNFSSSPRAAGVPVLQIQAGKMDEQ